MRKLRTFWKRIIAVVLIISLLPLTTFEAALDNVVYAMEELREQPEPVEAIGPESIEEVATTEAVEDVTEQETIPEAIEETVETEVQETISKATEETAWEAAETEVQETVEETSETESDETEPIEDVSELETSDIESGARVVLREDEETIVKDMMPEESYLYGYLDEEKNGYLSWDEGYNIVRYEVYRDNSLLATISANEEYCTEYYDTELQVGKQHSYRVEGKDENGQMVMRTQEVKLPEDLIMEGGKYKLSYDRTVYSVNTLGGTIDLNGHTLTVYSDVVMTEGTLDNSKYNSGLLSCGGDFLLTESKVNYLPIEVGGSMAVSGGAIRIKSLVLNGEQEQTVKVEENTEIRKIELQNYSEAGVHFASRIECYEFITNGCKFTYEEEGQYGYTLEEDVVIEGDYHLIGGCLNMNGHSMTIHGDFFHTGGGIRAGNGNLIIEGSYYLENSENDATTFVYYDGGVGYINVYGDVVLKDGYFSMSYTEGRYCFKIEGDLRICGTGTTNYGGASFLIAGDEKQVVYYEDHRLGYIYFGVDNHSEDGVFFSDPGSMEVQENGCKVTYYDEGATCGWKLEEDTVWNEDLIMNGGTLDLNGHNLTVTGDFIQMAGTMKVNGGTLCVEGDYRTQIVRKQEDGTVTYGTGRSSIDLSNDNDKIIVCGDIIIDTVSDPIGEPKGGLELKGNCNVKNVRNNYDLNLGQLTLVFSGEETQKFVSSVSPVTVYEIINRNKQGVVLSYYLYVTGRVVDETGTATGAITIGSNTTIEGGRWSGRLYISQGAVTLNQDMEVLGGIYVQNSLKLNGKTLKAKKIESTATIEIQGGQLLVEESLYLKSGRLVMQNPEDYVFVGGMFIIGNYGRYIGDGIKDGVIEVQGDFQIQSYPSSYSSGGEVKIGNTMVFSGEQLQEIWTCSNLTIGNIINRNLKGLRFDVSKETYQIHILGKCVDETRTVRGSTPIHVEYIDQIEGNVWGGKRLC